MISIRQQSGILSKECPMKAKTKRQLKIHKVKQIMTNLQHMHLAFLVTCIIVAFVRKILSHIIIFSDLKLLIEFDYEDIDKKKTYFDIRSINNPPTRKTLQ